MRKAFKYRLYPTQPQQKDLERTLSLCRHLYNAGSCQELCVRVCVRGAYRS
ncbi:helix-turn-helix domain-containing protein [Thermus scotoductus]|uniref:helix-turn-helix domain-containing protein n=1 Tax=Thermus scotoductus TaxID=37636 RepID=UPI0020A27517|nr:helix-turn-helix domain-containing protein [Thermus scotoductus]